ncbi:Disease resistance protein [Macleaya cordata]|uniref:Disease resistance protein n=1 Tax=Macleaya cordata TaxID=56857 RepID=A0A200QPU3_MACCD|nr:Disease resistance protein [Macleaya cordata]
MEVLNLLVTPITEIFKCLLPSLSYLVHYKRKIEQLKRKLEDLENTRFVVQDKVDAATKNLESIRRDVKAWLERVGKETATYHQDETTTIVGLVMNGEAIDMINKQCCKGWCSCGTRYDLGRKAEKKMVIIDELLNQEKSFGTAVSNPSCLQEIELMPIGQDFEAFKSRESIKNEVMAALKDEEIYLVGVHGMGGVGKTMLMNQVRKQVKEEKLFDEVVVTTISQNLDVKRIQSEIAEFLQLDKLKEKENISLRASMLLERLKQAKSILVILDDLWSADLNLSDLGIVHRENGHKGGCKVVITSRSYDVCNSMLCQKTIQVRVLSDEESWNLFKKNAGDVVESSDDLQTVARKIVKECKGLPIALHTLGRALRNNEDKLMWKETASQLANNCNFTSIEGMENRVFKSIRLSYNYLENKIIQKCFLLCCLFPEDHIIRLEELIMYVIGDVEILGDLENLDQIKRRLHTILKKLIASSLLISTTDLWNPGGTSVRMHDIVRDVAIRIASEEGNWFIVKAGGVGLINWSSNNISKCLRLSLMWNEISVLPDQPDLPNLLSLSFQGNWTLQNLPDGFFQTMRSSLTTLDLRFTGISSLPSSFFFLLNLRSLYLDSCDFSQFKGIAEIGKLKNLEMLSLKKCKLHNFPEEFGGLTKLKLLDLGDNNINVVPPNVISRMSRLEYLDMEGSGNFDEWEIEGDWENGTNASLAEVTSLHSLSNVKLKLYKKSTEKDFKHQRCISFRIDTDPIVNDEMMPHLVYNGYCSLSLSSDHLFPICDSIKELLRRVEAVCVDDCTTYLNSLGQLVEFKNKKYLSVKECHLMEYLIISAASSSSSGVVEENIPRNTFVALERLVIKSMDKLKQIVNGPIPVGMFEKLKELEIDDCKDMVSIFCPHLVKRVPNLEILCVDNCPELKDVFNLEEQSEFLIIEEGSVDDDDMFFRLREIHLNRLPIISNVFGVNIPLECVENLKIMRIFNCDKLRYLFSTAMSRSLQQLEMLEIFDCKGIVSIIKSEAAEMVIEDHRVLLVPPDYHTTTTTPQIIFPNLKVLDIRYCESLTQLWDGKDLEDFINVQKHENNIDEQLIIQQVLHDSKKPIMLPLLSELRMIYLPVFSSLYKEEEEEEEEEASSSNILDFPTLRVLEVSKCKNFKRIKLTHRSTLQLKKIYGDSEEWFEGLEWEDSNDKSRVQPLLKKVCAYQLFVL